MKSNLRVDAASTKELILAINTWFSMGERGKPRTQTSTLDMLHVQNDKVLLFAVGLMDSGLDSVTLLQEFCRNSARTGMSKDVEQTTEKEETSGKQYSILT